MLDKEVRERFKEFQKRTGEYEGLEIDDVRFIDNYPFNDDKNVKLIGSKKIASHEKLNQINDINGLPVYDASPNINTFVDENKFLNEVFEVEDNLNPDISFASEGNSSAGANFIIHKDKYFINNHRIVMKFTKKYYSKYIYYNIFKMKEKYAFKRGYIPSQKELKRLNIVIPIPKDLNKIYTSFKIQEAIVAFLEDAFNEIEKMREFFDKRYALIEKLDKVLISSTFMKEYVKVSFSKYAKENDIGFDIEDIEFEIKRVHSDNKDEVVCQKRMGFTPENSADGTINWYSVRDLGKVKGLYIQRPNTVKKTTMNLIKQAVDKNNTGKSEKLIPIIKGDILISFKLTVGVVKIYNSEKPAYCNEAIDILTVNDGCDNRYVAYNCMLEYPKYGTKTNNGVTLNDDDKKLIQIFVPKDLENYTSLEIQKIIADFIEEKQNKIQDEFDKMDKAYNLLERLHKAYLARTFTLIDWSVK